MQTCLSLLLLPLLLLILLLLILLGLLITASITIFVDVVAEKMQRTAMPI